MDLEKVPDHAARLCVEAQERLWSTVAPLVDADMRRPSRLPQWSVAHVLTHLARNADGHARRLRGALNGLDVTKYRDGAGQRSSEIAAGADRGAQEVISDLRASSDRLAELVRSCASSGWPEPPPVAGNEYGVRACPAHRLREVEMHHVDLGLGYGPSQWAPDYVSWDLPVLLRTVPDRVVDPADRGIFLAWLAGRRDAPPGPDALAPWG